MTINYICKICGMSSVNNTGLISHVSQIHGFSSKQYYDTYYKTEHEDECEYCGQPTRFIKFSRGYARFCSRTCTALGTATERKLIRYNKYGDGNYFSADGAEKLARIAKETAKDRFNSILYQLKQKYNVTDTVTNILQIHEIKQKAQNTTMVKYGVNNNFLATNSSGIAKRVQTCLNKYNVCSPLQNPEIKNKVIQTCMSKYGYANPAQSPDIQAKIRATNVSRYGVPCAMCNPAIRHKSYARYRYDQLPFDSSWEVAYYIYLTDHHIKFKYHATSFDYYSPTDNKWHVYECDFTLFDHTYIEIKGSHLLAAMIRNHDSKNYYKYLCMVSNHVHIITDVHKYVTYVKRTYGSKYLSKFRHVTSSSSRRKTT